MAIPSVSHVDLFDKSMLIKNPYGQSDFQKMNKATIIEGMQVTSEIKQEGDEYFEVSNFGNETKIGSSPFQKTNNEVKLKYLVDA